MKKESILFGLLRMALGWIFLWAFLDKLFGFGFATAVGKSWLDGVSPTLGFLKFGTQGPLANFFHALAGNAVVDWLFMLGLLGVGLALILGVGLRVASIAGSMMMLFIWLSKLPPPQNPFLDEHIIYILILLLMPTVNAGDWLGLGKWWSNTKLVKRFPLLK